MSKLFKTSEDTRILFKIHQSPSSGHRLLQIFCSCTFCKNISNTRQELHELKRNHWHRWCKPWPCCKNLPRLLQEPRKGLAKVFTFLWYLRFVTSLSSSTKPRESCMPDKTVTWTAKKKQESAVVLFLHGQTKIRVFLVKPDSWPTLAFFTFKFQWWSLWDIRH